MAIDSALALYEGTREDDLVSEEIDERVLKLLGLDDVFDIDYGTYITLLKERLAASRSFEKKLSSEEDELLVGEFKRVKGNVGRFKVRKKKITSENIGVTGPVKISKEKFFLTSKAIVPTPADSEDSKEIRDLLDALLKSVTDQNKLAKKKAEQDRKDSEDKRRRGKEKELEKPLERVKNLVKTVVKPFQGIIDRILRFIGFTFLGLAFNKFLDWINDPKNKRAVEVLGRFLKDWWPSLAFAAGLFLTPFGKFVRTTLTMLRTFIPQMVRFMAAHPSVFPIVAATVGGIAKIKESERMRPLTQKSQEDINKTLQSKEAPWYQKLGASFAGQSLNAPGGPVNPIGLPSPSAMYNGGGQIKKRKSFFGGGEVNVNDIAFDGGGGIDDNSGLRITGAGPDTQLIAAQPGEVMMSKKAVDKYGANFFLGLNKKAGGTNIPRMVNNIQLAAGGGMVGGRTAMPTMTGSRSPISFISNTLSRGGSSIRNIMNNFVNKSSSRIAMSSPSISNQSPQKITETYRSQGYSVSTYKSPVSTASRSSSYSSPVSTASRSSSYSSPVIKRMSSPQYAPVGTRVIATKTTHITLPPIDARSKGAPQVRPGTDIPKFSISSTNIYKQKTISSLEIGDLV